MNQTFEINYKAAPTLAKFHASTAFVRGVRGPIGSGKSVAMCVELFRRLQEQEPDRSGKRKSRWAIIRNTYPELETTTLKTWLDWFPEEIFGKVNRRVPICHYFRYNDIDAEIYFLALDRPEDVKKLLSLELTGVFVNEAREEPLKIVQTCCDRVGRYPSQRARPDHITAANWPTWYGVIMDTNSPDDDHWWAVMAGDAELPDDFTIPENWEFFTQPPAAFEEKEGTRTKWVLNPNAENLENLPTDYYRNLISGKSNMHVRVYVGNKYGSLQDGKVIYPEFSPDMHIAETELKYLVGRTIHVGLDFGMTPAAAFGQSDHFGQWRDLHELCTHGVGAERFSHLLKSEIATAFPDVPFENFEFWGDPSGGLPQSGSDNTYFQVLIANGIPVRGAPTQNPSTRVEAGREPLEKLLPGGKMGYQINKKCKVLIKGFVSGYHFPKIGTTGSVRYGEKAVKNRFSHVHEARQYGMCGAGFARKLIKREGKSRGPTKAKTKFSVYN
ncbi:hypothetical protein KAR91_12790 [Candidatus Pacearchaeota archaeon]|nr:hypothetical protein [Candidatus Pacearchaeota archaeon]